MRRGLSCPDTSNILLTMIWSACNANEWLNLECRNTCSMRKSARDDNLAGDVVCPYLLSAPHQQCKRLLRFLNKLFASGGMHGIWNCGVASYVDYSLFFGSPTASGEPTAVFRTLTPKSKRAKECQLLSRAASRRAVKGPGPTEVDIDCYNGNNGRHLMRR